MSIIGSALSQASSVTSLYNSAAKLFGGSAPGATPTPPVPGVFLGNLITGDYFTFRNFEVPDRAPFGGEQALSVHKLIGGQRIIDAMGRDDQDISWSGLFLSADADVRARIIDQFRVAGQPMLLTWGEHRYTVLIQSFRPSYEQPGKVPYSITFTVLLDQTKTVPTSEPTTDSQAVSDANSASLLGQALSAVNDAVKVAMPYINLVQQTISTVNGITGLNNPTLNSLQLNIASAQGVIAPLTQQADGVLSSLTTLGGVVTAATGPSNSSALLAASSTATQLPNLLSLGSTLTRLSRNIGLLGPQ